MTTNVIHLHSIKGEKADGVFAAVNIAARRMGYSDTLALRAAQQARDAYRRDPSSPARAVSTAKAELRQASPRILA
jgi:hypothetical protein